MNEAKDLIASGRAENFLMACVVNDKTELSEDKSQESGVEKFGPRILKPSYQQESANEQNQVEQHLSAVICGLFGQ
jgi:hypothetical protein